MVSVNIHFLSPDKDSMGFLKCFGTLVLLNLVFFFGANGTSRGNELFNNNGMKHFLARNRWVRDLSGIEISPIEVETLESGPAVERARRAAHHDGEKGASVTGTGGQSGRVAQQRKPQQGGRAIPKPQGQGGRAIPKLQQGGRGIPKPQHQGGRAIPKGQAGRAIPKQQGGRAIPQAQSGRAIPKAQGARAMPPPGKNTPKQGQLQDGRVMRRLG